MPIYHMNYVNPVSAQSPFYIVSIEDSLPIDPARAMLGSVIAENWIITTFRDPAAGEAYTFDRQRARQGLARPNVQPSAFLGRPTRLLITTHGMSLSRLRPITIGELPCASLAFFAPRGLMVRQDITDALSGKDLPAENFTRMSSLPGIPPWIEAQLESGRPRVVNEIPNYLLTRFQSHGDRRDSVESPALIAASIFADASVSAQRTDVLCVTRGAEIELRDILLALRDSGVYYNQILCSFCRIGSETGLGQILRRIGSGAGILGVAPTQAAPTPMVTMRETMIRMDQRRADSATWHKDTPQCERCNTPFSFTNRRHHCRRCGRCICKNCMEFTSVAHPLLPNKGSHRLDRESLQTHTPVCRACLGVADPSS